MKVSRTTESIRFDRGISVAEYVEGDVGHKAREGNEQDRLRLIDAAQEHLDGIVEEEYEQEDDESDEEGAS